MKSIIKALVPAWAKQKYAAAQVQRRSAQRRNARDLAARLTQQQIGDMLSGLGIGAGDTIMVQSAIGQFNNVEGGPAAVLSALLNQIGESGTLITPSFPHWSTAIGSNAIFDVVETRSDMGVLTEMVRVLPQAHRSLHPTHPVVAVGPRAIEITAGHHKQPVAFGLDTPFFRLAKGGGKIVMIGVDLNSLTAFHVYEDLVMPISWCKVYEDNPRTFEIVDRDRRTIRYEGYFHALESARLRDVERMRSAFERHAGLRRTQTDFSLIDVMDAGGVVVACLLELLDGRSAYGSVELQPNEVLAIRRALDVMKAT